MSLSKLPAEEELDFCYLLALLPMLKGIPEYSCLPELFSIIGHEKMIDLCKFAGGECIMIPTLEELSKSIESLKWYYYVFINGSKTLDEVPNKYRDEVLSILKQTVTNKC